MLAFLSFTLEVQGQNSLQPEVEILQVVKNFNRAFANNDIDNYFRMINDDFSIYLPENPFLVQGKENDREEFEHALLSGRTKVWYWQMFQPKVQYFESMAVITFHARGAFGPDKESSREVYLKVTDVLIRTNAEWKFAHIHVSKAD